MSSNLFNNCVFNAYSVDTYSHHARSSSLCTLTHSLICGPVCSAGIVGSVLDFCGVTNSPPVMVWYAAGDRASHNRPCFPPPNSPCTEVTLAFNSV